MTDHGSTEHQPERQARMILSCVVEAGDPAMSEAMLQRGAEQLLSEIMAGAYGPQLAIRANRVELDPFAAGIRSGRFRFVAPGDLEWPDRLQILANREPIQRRGGIPFGLWLRGPGDLAELVERSVSVVGARAATSYGESAATDLAADLADDGVTIVSGGAFGIDAAAHRGALAAGGPTIAALACGVDVCYPPRNASLLEHIAQDHLILSELPPGTNPTRVRFLARNRLIAASTPGTVIVEAALRSGARNTANWAQNCGHTLMAVPGSIYSSSSETPHQLIRDQQAVLVTGADDIRELIGGIGEALPTHRSGPTRSTDQLDETRMAVYEAVPARTCRPAGDIALLAGISVRQCLAELAALSDAGMVTAAESGWRIAPSRSRSV
jgi:DNA processing protein